ncbi:hypothetical protein PBI_SCTP2_370 [Salicola phage SCTP-2]|nr:hypothetical protein PBI_SCTP2_370 [Salicola phage SCTP-2]
MSFIDEVKQIVGKCSYKPGWEIMVKEHETRGVYIQLHNTQGMCSITSEHQPWVSGKRYLSEFMCRQEIVGVVFALIKDAELHEIHEWFRYKGRSIYNPHLDPDKLAEVASKKESFVTRDDSMTNA